MDLLGIAALGGLERITIVAGAVIIGYWGYRLYAAEKNAGLVFMGLAVVVLVGALATGSSHVKNVAEGYQLASIPATAPETPDSVPNTPFDATETTPSPFAEEPAPVAAPTAASNPQGPIEQADTSAVASAPVAPEPAAAVPPVEAEAAVIEPQQDAPEAIVSPVRLATGQELGGRIVSVKSENVSLEWSPDSE